MRGLGALEFRVQGLGLIHVYMSYGHNVSYII